MSRPLFSLQWSQPHMAWLLLCGRAVLETFPPREREQGKQRLKELAGRCY